MKKRLLPFLCFALFSARGAAQEDQTPTPQWRPQYHFTPTKNWTNDPNGLLYVNGVYHLYNQQNPFENKWGHMSWGHATTTDLVHWKHLPLAMPEAINNGDTIWRFSGSAVLDKNNTSGFCTSKNCIVAVYTAHQPNLKKESQYVAYSNDGGATFTNYDHNPVIDLNKHDFRDPNVFWYEKAKAWRMVVSLPAEHKVRIYGSADLKKWDLLSEFGPQGYTNAYWECPFLIQLPVDNNPSQQKWVLANSAGGQERGTYMQYFVGDFDGTTFTNDNPADTVLSLDYGDCFYAAIPWNNLPGNEKLFIGWMHPGDQPTSPWKGQMSIPRFIGLAKTAEGIRLIQKPSPKIKSRLAEYSGGRSFTANELRLPNGESPVKNKVIEGNSYWLETELDVENGTAGFRIDNDAEIGYDAANNQVYVDRSRSGNTHIRKDKVRQVIPLAEKNKPVKLEILFDRSSLEVFVNDGEKVLSTFIFPKTGAGALTTFASDGKATMKSLKIWDLSEINK